MDGWRVWGGALLALLALVCGGCGPHEYDESRLYYGLPEADSALAFASGVERPALVWRGGAQWRQIDLLRDERVLGVWHMGDPRQPALCVEAGNRITVYGGPGQAALTGSFQWFPNSILVVEMDGGGLVLMRFAFAPGDAGAHGALAALMVSTESGVERYVIYRVAAEKGDPI